MKILGAYKEAFKNQKRYLILRGGAGSGKSVFAAQKIISRLLSENPHKFLVLRKVGSTIKNSVFALFKEIILHEDLEQYFTINKSDFSITCKLNGNQIVMSGLDDPEKIKSVAGITGMWLEEATEFTYDDWEQLQLRIRGQHKHYIQFIITFNPVSEKHWLKTEVWDKFSKDESYMLVTTFKNNSFLSQEDVKHFEQRLIKNQQMWRIYGLGQWGELQTGGEIVHRFNYKYHTNTIEYNPELPLHISFDFNVMPHVSISVYQFEEKKIKMIDEIGLPHPSNLTADACKHFLNKYKNHKEAIFIYGDPAGRHQDTRTQAGQNDYTIIMSELASFHPRLKIHTKAPSVSVSTNFLNAILNSEIENMSLEIDVDCKKMIDDLTYLKQNSDGGKLIEYEKDQKTGVRYEKYGHFFDTLRYFLTQCFPSEYEQFKNGGASTFKNVKLGRRRVSKNSY